MRRSVLVLSAALVLGATPAVASPGLVELGRLPGDLGSRPAVLNDAGEVAGESITEHDRHAVRWGRDGKVVRLPDLDGGQSTVTDMNNSGTIVGSAAFDPAREWAAVRWDGDRVKALPVPQGVHYTSAAAVSESGVIVHGAGSADFDDRREAVRWNASGAVTSLGAGQATAINARGTAVGMSSAGWANAPSDGPPAGRRNCPASRSATPTT